MSEAATTTGSTTTTATTTSGGTTTQPGGSGALTTPAANLTPSPVDWTSGFKPEQKGWIENKGIKDPGMLLDAYQNLEKHVGVPQERLLKLPEKADSPEWQDVYNRLGRPKEAKDYSVTAPEGHGPDFVAKIQGIFHEVGLPKGQAEKLFGKWNEYVGEVSKAQADAEVARLNKEHEALKKDWGNTYDERVNVGKRATQAFGITPENYDALEKVMGLGGVAKFAFALGSKLGESSFVDSGSTGKGKGFGNMSPTEAKNQIANYMKDAEFGKKFAAGDREAREKMDHLNRMAVAE